MKSSSPATSLPFPHPALGQALTALGCSALLATTMILSVIRIQILILNHFIYFSVYTSVAFGTPMGCAAIATIHLQSFFTLPDRCPRPSKTAPLPQPMVTSILSSVSVNLPILGISCKWIPMFVLRDWLTSLGTTSSRFIHVLARIRISFL